MGIAFLFLVCSSCAGPSEAYVAADLATFHAVAPSYSAYVEADTALNDEQRARRLAVIATWELRIRQAGGAK